MTHTGDEAGCPTCGPLYAEARAAHNDQQMQRLRARTTDPVHTRAAARFNRANRLLVQALSEHRGTT